MKGTHHQSGFERAQLQARKDDVVLLTLFVILSIILATSLAYGVSCIFDSRPKDRNHPKDVPGAN